MRPGSKRSWLGRTPNPYKASRLNIKIAASWAAGEAAMGRSRRVCQELLGALGLALLLAGCARAQAAPAPAPRGVSRAAAYEAAPPPGFVAEPVDPDFYRQRAQQARERFRVNETFFRNINSTKVPKILGVANGTFEVLPLNINATPRAEDALDGARAAQALRSASLS